MTSNLKIIGVFAVHSPCRVLGYSLPNPYRQHNGKVIIYPRLQISLAAAIAPRSTPVCPPETIFDTSIYNPTSSAANPPLRRQTSSVSLRSSLRMRSASSASPCMTAYSSKASSRFIASIISSLCGIAIVSTPPLLLWEQLSRANRVRFCPSAFCVAVHLQLIDAFLPMTLRLKQASCVSLLSAIRSLRRACTV